MISDAVDIAAYVVNTAHEAERPITNLHLQKILYFLECKYMVEENNPLMHDVIEAWKLGPVYPNVYHEYKIFGANNITRIPRIFKSKISETGEILVEDYEYDGSRLSSNIKSVIRPHIISLLREHHFNLVKKTHQHEPWIKLKPKIFSSEKNALYDKQELREYFSKNKHLLDEVLS